MIDSNNFSSVPKFRTQWDERSYHMEVGFPASVVQTGMSPDVAQMVRTRSVGGNLDEYEMNGIPNDAPFDSEYLDFFDMQDMIQNGDPGSDEPGIPAVERQNAENNSPGKEAPPNNVNSDNQNNEE